jgi:hypothetical protein
MVLVGIVATATGPTMDNEQLIRLLNGAVSDIRDVSFAYEGSTEFVGPANILRDELEPESYSVKFQGIYAYRRDGATALDLYKSSGRPIARIVHEQVAMLKGRVERTSLDPDQRSVGSPPVHKFGGGPGSMKFACSAENFCYLWYFMSHRDAKTLDIDQQGWESVDGRNCLRVEIWRAGNRKKQGSRSSRFWIDMERGAQPLKVEVCLGPDVLLRLDQVMLVRTATLDGKNVWLPVSGETNSFIWEDRMYDKPVFRDRFSVDDGTIVVNQDLPDDYFTMKGLRSRHPGSRLELSREYEAIPALRLDPGAVTKRLEESLALAKKQSELLAASSLAKASTSSMAAWQFATALAGIACIGLACYFRWATVRR